MTINTIDSAISTHIDWIVRFRAALAGTNSEHFDVDHVRNDQACDLGHWLVKGNGRSLISPDSFKAIEMIHETFHEVAYLLATMFNHAASLDEADDLIAELDNLSRQLVDLLSMARRHG